MPSIQPQHSNTLRPGDKRVPPEPDVFDYLDVAAYLRDVYAHRKEHRRGFSFRAFSRRVGLRTPNHLKRIMDEERTLTPEMSVRYAQALGLEGDAAAYFVDLAAFSRASTAVEQEAAYQRMRGYRAYRRSHHLDAAHAEYCAHWYIPAIRELVVCDGVRDDADWIADHLIPPISPSEARKALDTLLALGLVERVDGRLQQARSIATTGAETRGLHVRRYHRSMMEQAQGSMDRVPAPERDISAVTFCADEDTLREVKERVQQFRQELVALAAQRAGGDRVVQLNIQLFPLSRSATGDDP